MKDKVIAFDRDVIKLAAKNSGYSEKQIKEAYAKFTAALKKAVGCGEWTRIELPIGYIYLEKDRVNEPRPQTPLGFCRPDGQLLDLINTMKVQMGFMSGNIFKNMKNGSPFSEMRKIGMDPEEIERRQNEDFKNT